VTRLQRNNWEEKSISYERTILDFFKRKPEAAPDGSFIMSLVLAAYAAGKREGKRRT
jgi:hypothetical protein